ncbi:MAG: class I SAM-dependent methyltransferase [Rudaea sp.]
MAESQSGESRGIRNVSDTALWVAMYRASESEREDALFNDPYARRLAGDRGAAIVAQMPSGKTMSWPLVVRTAVMDEIVLRCVRDGARTVLNLAAGLDARPYRLNLPADLRWLHVDMPEMVAYFAERMQQASPRCNVEFVEADLRDADARRRVFSDAAQSGNVLVISEGLLVYLERPQVASLAHDLGEIAHARWWLTDLASPTLLKYLERQWAPALRAGNAPLIFGPEENTAFFTPFGWREVEFRSTWEESLRLDRKMRGALFWRWLLRLLPERRRETNRRMSGIVLLESTRR